MNVITTVKTELEMEIPKAESLESGVLMRTVTRVEARKTDRFENLNEALDFCATLDAMKIKRVSLNVDLSQSKKDRLGRLEQADYPWMVSYPDDKAVI